MVYFTSFKKSLKLDISMSLPFLMFCPSNFNGILIRSQPPALAGSKALAEAPVVFCTRSTAPTLAFWVFPPHRQPSVPQEYTRHALPPGSWLSGQAGWPRGGAKEDTKSISQGATGGSGQGPGDRLQKPFWLVHPATQDHFHAVSLNSLPSEWP